MDELELRGLTVRAPERTLVDDVGLELTAGELVGLVGASGSGKTLTCRALLGLIDLAPGVVRADLVVRSGGREHRPYEGSLGRSRAVRDRAFHPLRGGVLGYLPQEAGGALVPFQRVGRQLAAVARLREGRPSTDPVGWLVKSGFTPTDAARVAGAWPHQLSGGMAQRVGIACALARGSRFLVADEPTTGLDAPLQVRILAALRALADGGLGVLLVTHDPRALAEVADRVVVLDHGRRVEELSGADLRAGIARSEPGQRLVDAARLAVGAR